MVPGPRAEGQGHAPLSPPGAATESPWQGRSPAQPPGPQEPGEALPAGWRPLLRGRSLGLLTTAAGFWEQTSKRQKAEGKLPQLQAVPVLTSVSLFSTHPPPGT